MLIFKQPFLQLTRRSLTANRRPLLQATFTRFNSSYKVDVNNTTAATSANSNGTTANNDKTSTVDDNKKQSLQLKSKIHFMPVINIPETEFAYNRFFSLHRPLLGLSDEEEKPFFSNHSSSAQSPEERDQERLDKTVADHMINLQHFVEPSSQETEPEVKSDGIEFSITEETEEILLNEEDGQTLPVFHMPESGDVLDYLTAIENRMKKEHARLDADDDAKLSRLRKMEIVDKARRKFNTSPRFYVTSKRQRR
ncbi:MAG: hypothetical protein EXX96DRAFT_616297 [Benjaminiella poitrasii]|nr:MAG: hypothetical protein EXX96DRAFT_616297 [Benjaminiella poitrasii]